MAPEAAISGTDSLSRLLRRDLGRTAFFSRLRALVSGLSLPQPRARHRLARPLTILGLALPIVASLLGSLPAKAFSPELRTDANLVTAIDVSDSIGRHEQWLQQTGPIAITAVLHCHFVSIEKMKLVRIGRKADLAAEGREVFAVVDDETGLSTRQFDMHQRHSAGVFAQCDLAAQDVPRGFDDRQMFRPNPDAFGRRWRG